MADSYILHHVSKFDYFMAIWMKGERRQGEGRFLLRRRLLIFIHGSKVHRTHVIPLYSTLATLFNLDRKKSRRK